MTVAPAWVRPYVGIPFVDRGYSHSGCHCWGLSRLVLSEQFGVELPTYNDAYETVADSVAISLTMARERRKWTEIDPDKERAGDVLMLRFQGMPSHVGTVVAPGLMLHAESGPNAVIERYRSQLWRHRILGIYRHADLV